MRAGTSEFAQSDHFEKGDVKQDFRAEMHRVAERMFKAGTTARRKVADITQDAIREWAEIWHRVLGEHAKSNGHGS